MQGAPSSAPGALAASSTTAWLGLGANLGDARLALADALTALDTLPGTRVCAVSSLYRSAPVDAGGPDYLNAVARVSTQLAAEALLQSMHEIEARAGRERPYRNAPRVLDLDLLLYDQQTSARDTLRLPHPRMHQRAFVLAPLAELAPALIVPGKGAVTALLAALGDQRIERLPGGSFWAPLRFLPNAAATIARRRSRPQ